MINSDYLLDHLFEIIIIVAALVIFFLQIRKKTLTYTVLTDSGLDFVSDKAETDVQIHYKGKAVPNVRLVEVRIRNSGSVPIEPRDYIEPVRLRLPNSKILSSEVRDAYSVGAYIETEVSNQSEIVLSRTLLNPKDFFDVKMLLADGEADLSVAGQIVGITRIQNFTGREASYYILLSLVAVNLFAIIARFLGLLDRGFVIFLQIFTLLIGVWMSFDLRAGSQDLEK